MAGTKATDCGSYRARACRVGMFALMCIAMRPMLGQSERTPGIPTISSTHAVHSLSATEAARGLPVKFRAVVTFYDVPTQSLFVSDPTGAIYLWAPKDRVLPVTTGTLVEVNGVTEPGDFAPIVTKIHLRVLGQSHHPLAAARVTVLELASGLYDCRRVELEGLIRAVSRAGPMVEMKIATRDGAIVALTPARPGENYERLIDARVRVRGVAAVEYNIHRQMTGSHLFVASLDDVSVLRLTRGDPYELPLRGILQLAQFDQHLKLSDRVHLRGRVVLQWPGRSLCVQDATGGLCVDTSIAEPYALGSLVDLVGYHVFAAQIPALSDAVVRQSSMGGVAPVAALPVTAKEVMGGEHSGKLVSLEGELVGVSSDPQGWQLTIRSRQVVFSAVLAKGASSLEIGDWRIGSYVRVAGVCVNEVDPRVGREWVSEQQIASFRLMLRHPADVLVLRNPSWWTPAHTWMALSTVVLLTLAVFGWVVLLRRRVEQRTQELRESENRFRHLAHHDSLTGVPNRAWFHERADQALALSGRSGECVGLLLLDLDHFKPVNDTLGHDAGDAMLCALAQRVAGAIRKVDTLARLGGDEFAVILVDLGDADDAEKVAIKLLESICQPVEIAGRLIGMSASIGVAVFPEDGDSVTELLRSADLAMYQSKKHLRGGVRRYRREATELEIAAAEVQVSTSEVGLGCS